jgi:hypothetical protein
MSELGIGMLGKVGLELIPVAAIVTNFFAGGANGQQAAQTFDVGQGLGKFLNQRQPFLLFHFALGDVAPDH